MKEKNSNGQFHNNKGQRSNNPESNDNFNGPVKGMNREAEDELLTTGGPVDRSAVEDQGDRGVIDANTGGMEMKDEEANTSKDSFPRGITGSTHDHDPDEDEKDYSQDKTEGIVNPRSTIAEWADWKKDLKQRKQD